MARCSVRFRAALLFVAIMTLSAATPVAQLQRDGDEAFLRGDYEAAIARYTEAEARGTDPGHIAFNKAAAYYHLKRYDDAEVHFRRALEDDVIPTARRARALFNLGNCLVQQAVPGSTQLPRLRDAIVCYQLALEVNLPDEAFREDARHNLELAKLLWSQARAAAKTPNPPKPNDFPERNSLQPPPKKDTGKQEPSAEPGTPEGKGKDGKKTAVEPVPLPKNGKSEPKSTDQPPPPLPGGGNVVRDPGNIQKLSVEKTREQLRLAEERLRRERQRLRQSAEQSGRVTANDL